MALNQTMDYGSLLQLAKKTSDMKLQAKRSGPNSAPVRTSAEHKNAELEKKKLLDANIAKFLAKRDAEERKRKNEANDRREGLLAIRNKDSKARKRVKIMNKSAKSADKSAIEDAVGPSDYYVIEEPLCFMSKESLAQEEKFLEKLCKTPQDEIFSKKKVNLNKDLSGTKDRVKMALLLGDSLEKKEKREAKEKLKELNHKGKSKNDSVKIEEEEEEPKEEEKPPQKPRQPRPPPMNYLELLKLAEKLQQEPVQEAPKEKAPELRPMTTKERELYLLEEASRKRKEEGWKARPKITDKKPSSWQLQGSKANSSVIKEDRPMPSIPRIPKINSGTQQKKNDSYEERRPKSSSREEKCATSNQKPSHRAEEKTITSKPSSRQHESTTTAKQDRNRTERTPKEDNSRHSLEEKSSRNVKPQETRREKDHSSSARPSQQQRKLSPMSRDVKEARPGPSMVTKSTPSSSDGNSKKPPSEKARSITSSDTKLKLQQRHPAPSNSKPREHQSDTHVPKTFPPSDIKSRPSSNNSKPKQSTAEVKSKQPLPSSKQQSPDIKSRQPSSLDSKTKQNHSETKSRSLTPLSDCKPKQHLSDQKSRSIPSSSKPKQHPSSDIKSRQASTSYSKTNPPDVKPRNFPPSDVKPRNFPPSDVKPRNVPPSDVRLKNFPPSEVKPRKFPPPNNGQKQFQPADVKRKQFPPADVRRGPPKPQAKKRRVIDSDEEYDSEVADFIDDGDDDAEDYSKHIKEIFGYDRSKYRSMDDDDECMESSFSQQMKEEFKSTKLGIMEDLEDIRREKQREAMLKKKRRLE